MTDPPEKPSYSVRRRLLWLLSVAIGMVAITQAIVAYRVSFDEANEIFDYHMRQVALALRGGLPATAPRERTSPGTEEENFDLVIQVWSSSGSSVFESASHANVPKSRTSGFSTAEADGKHYRVFSLQSADSVIQVAQEISARRELAQSLAARTMLPTVLLAPLLLGFVWWMVTRAVKPIVEAQRQVASREAEDLSSLPTRDLPDEVKPLVVELNFLFDRLRYAMAAQRAFVADAAHELRSPLAALRLQAQGVMHEVESGGRDAAALRLIAGVDRATRVIDQLMALARQESSEEAATRLLPVRLGDIATQALSDVVPQARERDVDIGMGPSDPGDVLGDGESLRMLVRNLLENAVKYSPARGVVDLCIRQDGDRLKLIVEDSGLGIPAHVRERVFDRFYRVGGSETTGAGLGLAIVKAIADRHGAVVSLESSPRLGGLVVAVEFELAHRAPRD